MNAALTTVSTSVNNPRKVMVIATNRHKMQQMIKAIERKFHMELSRFNWEGLLVTQEDVYTNQTASDWFQFDIVRDATRTFDIIAVEDVNGIRLLQSERVRRVRR